MNARGGKSVDGLSVIVKIMLTLAILALALWWIYSSFIVKNWKGLYESRTSNDIYSVNFGSREACEDWLDSKRSNPGMYTGYECGLNCKPPTTSLGLYKCDETFD